MKKISLLLSLVLILSVFTGCTSNNGGGSGNTDVEEQYELKMGIVLPEADPLYSFMEEMGEAVEERSDGRLNVEVIAAGALGDTVDVLEQARTGMGVGVILDAGRFSDFVPNMNIFEAPYIFNSYDEAYKFTQSEMFAEWLEEAEEFGVHVSSWNWFQGARQFWTQKELKTLDDFKNLKIRTGSSPMWQEIIKSFGANPVEIPGGESYSALQQNVVDGMEAQIGTSGSFEEVISHITKTNHFMLLTGVVLSKDWYENLPEDIQIILDEEITKAGEAYSKYNIENLAEMEATLTERGITINEIDQDMLKEASDSVYDKFPGYRELKEEIRAIVEE